MDSVDDDVFAHGKAPQSGTQILVAGAPDVGMRGEQVEAVGYGIDQAVGGIYATALGGNVVPDVVQIGIGLGCAAMSPSAR